MYVWKRYHHEAMVRFSLHRIFAPAEKKATEGMKIEKILVRSLKSPLASERKRLEKRILRHGVKDPYEMIAILLRYYHHPNDKVQKSVRHCLSELTKSRIGMDAVLNNIIHPSREVRRAVLAFLGERAGIHAITYASFYEQTLLLAAMARNKDIPVDDIEALAEVSKQTFLDGEVIEAIKDISSCLEFVKHRYRSAEQLRSYIVDILRMAPDLTRIGVFGGAIEESLKKAVKASRSRRYDETREIIEERMKEATIRNELLRIGKIVNEIVTERPNMPPAELAGADVWVISRLHELVDSVTSSTVTGKRSEAIEALRAFLEDEFLAYYDDNFKKRIENKDRSAVFTLYTIGIVCLKLSSGFMQSSSEDIYQRYFRKFEGEPSIHLVMWPEIVMQIIG
ncbi:MAG: class I tRNA ligase family protein [Methanomassiliicoccales archaeon]